MGARRAIARQRQRHRRHQRCGDGRGHAFQQGRCGAGHAGTRVAGHHRHQQRAATVNDISNGTTGLVPRSRPAPTWTVGKAATDGAAVDFAGTAGARRLAGSGGADGTVAANSKDAVNGGQLYTTNQQVTQQGTTHGREPGRHGGLQQRHRCDQRAELRAGQRRQHRRHQRCGGGRGHGFRQG